jgi:hypothetical protein
MIFIHQPAGRAYVLKIPNHLGKQTSPIPVLRMTNTETKETFNYYVTYINDDYYGVDLWIQTINNMRPGEYQYEIAGNRGMIWVGSSIGKKTYYGSVNDTVKYYRD